MAADKAQRRQQLANFEKKATRVAVGLVIAGFVLALVALVLGSAEIFPYEYTVTVMLTVMLVPIGSALLIGAMGGLYIMGGWKVTPFGIVFVAGFAALVYGIAGAGALWRLAGIGLLAISGAAFFTAGMGSGHAPASARHTWGSASSLIGGAAVRVEPGSGRVLPSDRPETLPESAESDTSRRPTQPDVTKSGCSTSTATKECVWPPRCARCR